MEVSQDSAVETCGRAVRGRLNRTRYLAVSAIAALTLLVLLPARAQSDERPYCIETLAMRDGSVEIEGARFNTVDALRSKLVEIKKRHPDSYIGLEYEKGATFRQLGGAILMIQETGIFPQVGFLTEPRAVTPDNPIKPPR
jgi:biopolymer transport protein ExbD